MKDFVNLDSDGYVISDESCKTSRPGVFVAGDCRTKNLRQLVTAASDGSIAATEAINYLNSKKWFGILTESKISNNKLEYIIIGIGINVNLELNDFNDEIKNKATSLLIETKKTFERKAILNKFLENFYKQYNELLNENKINILRIYKSNSFVINKRVKLKYNNSIKEVIPIDILENGSLIIKNLNNEKENIISGEISLIP